MSTTTTNTYRLYGSAPWDEAATSVRALLFGRLADIAWPVVTSYRSDLFHDARWINENVNGPTVFYWGVRDTGTSIGLDHQSVAAMDSNTLYRVDLTDGGADTWYVTITSL